MKETRYTSSKETLLKYDYVESVLLLEKEDKEINLRLLNDAVKDIESYLEIDLESVFDFETVPEALKEACFALFSMKHAMYKSAADFAKGDEMEDVIEMKIESGKLDFDEFFNRFSTIPVDVELLLDDFKENFLSEKDFSESA